jgi:hypothetical protein
MEDNKKKEDPETQFGIVVMLDVLGVSSYSIEECKDFIKKQEMLQTHLKDYRNFRSHLAFNKYSDFITFGDTIIICWPIKQEETEHPIQILQSISIELAVLMVWGIENRILFRGSVSIGDYILDKNTALGPAIFDANNWYNSADWFGIIFTPKSQLFIESAINNFQRIKNEKSNFLLRVAIPYDVPLTHAKNDKKIKTFLAINWPYSLRIQEEFNYTPSALEKTLDCLYKLPLSKEGEQKILNGLEFYKTCAKNFENDFSQRKPVVQNNGQSTITQKNENSERKVI